MEEPPQASDQAEAVAGDAIAPSPDPKAPALVEFGGMTPAAGEDDEDTPPATPPAAALTPAPTAPAAPLSAELDDDDEFDVDEPEPEYFLPELPEGIIQITEKSLPQKLREFEEVTALSFCGSMSSSPEPLHHWFLEESKEGSDPATCLHEAPSGKRLELKSLFVV